MTKYPSDHPEDAEAWIWDEPGEGGNIDELAAHHITRDEVEQVWSNTHKWARDKALASGDYKMMGRTNGGRKLTVVVEWDRIFRTVRPITGWDATLGEQTRYFE